MYVIQYNTESISSYNYYYSIIDLLHNIIWITEASYQGNQIGNNDLFRIFINYYFVFTILFPGFDMFASSSHVW